jgi:hypothetical protein
MGEEIELAAKSAGAVVGALAEDANALGPVREYATYVESRLHLRHLPKLVERAMAVAEKISESGLPRRAFEALDEPLVTAILEGMAEETDPDLVQSWENLLANAAVEGGAEVRRGFPQIMRRLDHRDARVLEHWGKDAKEETFRVELKDTMPGDRDGPALDTLASLGLVNPAKRFAGFGEIIDDDGASSIRGYTISELGWTFLQACRPPAPRSG